MLLRLQIVLDWSMCYQIRFDLKNKKRKYPSIVNLIMLTLVLSQQNIFFAIIRLSKDKEWYSMEVNFIGLSVSTQINFQWKLTSLMRSFFYKEKERSVSTKMQVDFFDNVHLFIKTSQLYWYIRLHQRKERYSMKSQKISFSVKIKSVTLLNSVLQACLPFQR